MATLQDLITSVDQLQDDVTTLRSSVTGLTQTIDFRKSALDNTVNNIELIEDNVILLEQNVVESTQIAQEAAAIASKIKRGDFLNNISYIGKAPGGTLENQPLWTISKIVVDVDGTTVKTVAVDVAWTNRLTATYI